MMEQDIYRVVVDSLSAHVAILDEQGAIIETNLAWQNFQKKMVLKNPLTPLDGTIFPSVMERAMTLMMTLAGLR